MFVLACDGSFCLGLGAGYLHYYYGVYGFSDVGPGRNFCFRTIQMVSGRLKNKAWQSGDVCMALITEGSGAKKTSG